MTLRQNSAAARDIAYHLHSYTNAKKQEAEGSLVVTGGKGVYIYTGIAFFRELPEGVPGAYRLFVNLLSVSRPSR